MLKGKVKLAVDLKAGIDDFERTAIVSRDLRREFTIVIVLEYMESEARLFQVAHTLNPFGPRLALVQHRQQQRRQNANDGNDHQKLDQGECSFAPLSALLSTRPCSNAYEFALHGCRIR